MFSLIKSIQEILHATKKNIGRKSKRIGTGLMKQLLDSQYNADLTFEYTDY